MLDKILRLAGTVNDSIVDGPGLRYSIFFQGCSHHCKGCHNPQTWDFRDGKMVKVIDIIKDIRSNPLLTGVTLSGGDPFDSPGDAIVLTTAIKNYFPDLDIWMYTGYKYEDLFKISKGDDWKVSWQRMMLAKQADVIVDGPYAEKRRDLSLQFRGSSNQRIIDVKASKEQNKIVLWKPEETEEGVA